MPQARVHKRADGLYEVAPPGRLRHGAVTLAFTLLGLPAVLMLLLALMTVLAALTLAVPPAAVAAACGALWWRYEHRGSVARRARARLYRFTGQREGPSPRADMGPRRVVGSTKECAELKARGAQISTLASRTGGQPRDEGRHRVDGRGIKILRHVFRP